MEWKITSALTGDGPRRVGGCLLVHMSFRGVYVFVCGPCHPTQMTQDLMEIKPQAGLGQLDVLPLENLSVKINIPVFPLHQH